MLPRAADTLAPTDEVAPGIYAISGLKAGRSYIVEGEGGIALVDTSTADVSAKIIAAIQATGHHPEDLRAIVATHYHYDHTGNAAVLIERTGAELYVHAADAPYVDGTLPWVPTRAPWGFMDSLGPKPFAVKVDRILRGGEMLPFAGGLRVVHAPGHTPGHIALYAKERCVLFAGDSLMNIAGVRLPMYMSTDDMEQAKQSVHRLAELDFDIALPGHGEPILSRANEKIAEWADAWL